MQHGKEMAITKINSPKQQRVCGGWGKFQINALNVTLIQNVLGKTYTEVPTNITERVQLTFKVTFIYRKFLNSYTDKFI